MSLERALSIAFADLNRRERTVAEIRARLLKRDLHPDVVEAALRELGEQGYLDDARFARLYVQDKQDLSQWGSGRIRRGLLEHGIEPGIADAALMGAPAPGQAIVTGSGATGASDCAAATDHAGELGRALALLHKRFPEGLDDPRDWERALGVLMRRGYEYELAVDALAEHRREAGWAQDCAPSAADCASSPSVLRSS